MNTAMLKTLLDHTGTIYAVNALASLTFALLIYSLLRNRQIPQARRWATPFADTFLVLAVMHSLRVIVDLFLKKSGPTWVLVLIYLMSGVTNYLLILSAVKLSEPALKQKWMLSINKWLSERRPYIRSPLFWMLCAISLLGLAGSYAPTADTVASVIALILMGAALYNYRIDGDRFMAWVAMLSSVVYALIHVIREPWIFYYLSQTGVFSNDDFRSMLNLISLILKFGFFFSAYSLMLSISAKLQGFNHLLESVNREEKEYLESDGLVRSICEWLATNTVRLYIKLPGANDDQVAVFHYPAINKANDEEPKTVRYREDTSYDKVMSTGATYREDRENNSHWLFGEASIIAAPIFFYDSVIGCLEAEVNSRGARRQHLERVANLDAVANLISPAVQTYREMSALNRLSQDLAHRQIKIVKYDLQRDLDLVAKDIFNAVSPSVIALSINAGFSEYRIIYPPDTQFDLSIDLTESAAAAEDQVSSNGKYRLFRKKMSIAKGPQPEDPLFGSFVLGIEKGKKRRRHPTIGTNLTCRRALSDLVADALLDFVRGHLNQLTDLLGVGLSGPDATTPAGWLQQVEQIAQAAKLPWAVASYSHEKEFNPAAGNTFGKPEMVELVVRAESPEEKYKWKLIDEKTQLWLYPVDDPRVATSHIIKKVLLKSQEFLQRDQSNSAATLWLGVSRPNFGSELYYVSPWRYFIDRFCEIADSALLRILIMGERNTLLAELQNVLAGTIILPFLSHQLAHLALEIGLIARQLGDLFQENECLKQKNSRLDLIRSNSEELLELLRDLTQFNADRPCSLSEAIQRAGKIVGESLLKTGVRLVLKQIPSDAILDIPLHAASNTIAIAINNSKDAIVNASGADLNGTKETGLIEIAVSETEDAFVCDITDNGPGVPPNFPDPPFNAKIESSKLNGHGVGLYYSSLLLRLYGGEITLPHRGPHPPTTFRISFPKWKVSPKN
jgi:signal transduction histidine kinase